MRLFKVIILTTLFIAFSGCANIRQVTMSDEDNLLSGSGSIMVDKDSKKAKGFEQLELGKLLEDYGLTKPVDVSKEQTSNVDMYKYRRNDLQDRIIAASNQRCGTYIRDLVSSKAQSQMGWGGIATLLSGAASVVTPLSVARALSAGSTVSNGILSQYNEAYFNSLTVTLISSGITKKRESILQHIDGERRKSLSDYPVNRSISDALSYHAACNIISGLETATAATQATNISVKPSFVTLEPLPNPAVKGVAFTLTAKVNAVNPTGTVTFMDDVKGKLGEFPVVFGFNKAEMPYIYNEVGIHTLTAIYNGDANNASSTSSTLSLTVK